VPSWPWSYGSWIYNYLYKHWCCEFESRIRARCTTLCDKVCQWLATGRWFSLDPPVSSTNKTDHHDITEILLKVALNTIKQANLPAETSIQFPSVTEYWHFWSCGAHAQWPSQDIASHRLTKSNAPLRIRLKAEWIMSLLNPTCKHLKKSW